MNNVQMGILWLALTIITCTLIISIKDSDEARQSTIRQCLLQGGKWTAKNEVCTLTGE